MNKAKAFSLIELLIVVAVIAILAVIATPNFLEAQTRSKVSRVQADIRTVVIGIEAYAVDWNEYPADYVMPILSRSGGGYGTAEGYIPPSFSTPIAYLDSVRPIDPFIEKGIRGVDVTDPIYLTLFYQNVETSRRAVSGDASAYGGQPNFRSVVAIKTAIGWSNFPWEQRYGSWKIGSLGPDCQYSGGPNIYDSSNGTISSGDIYRSQKANTGGY